MKKWIFILGSYLLNKLKKKEEPKAKTNIKISLYNYLLC